jgi:hypothetical protein
MMKNLSQVSITVPLGISVHQLARQFCHRQRPQVARQIYLNTLAVGAVNFYLQCMGIETDWESSYSYDPTMHAAMDVADLNIKGWGKLECRPLLAGEEVVCIPPDVWFDRIGYMAVQLAPSLREATLLGFTPIGREQFPIAQLRSLDEFVESQPQAIARSVETRVKLTRWLENAIEMGWQSLESILETEQMRAALSLRSAASTQATVKRAKLIDLGLQLGDRSVVLLMAIAPSVNSTSGLRAEQKVEILAQVHPVDGEMFLPTNLKISLLSTTSGVVLQEVQSRTYDNYIQLKRFRGVFGECFDIQIALGEVSVTETFEI